MISYRAHGLGILHHWIQFIGTAALLWVWRFSMDWLYQPSYLQYSKLLVYTLAVSAIFGLQSVHPERRFRQLLQSSNTDLSWQALRQTLIIFSTITIFVSAIKDNSISRAYLFSSFPLLCGFLFATDKWLPRALSAYIFGKHRQQQTLVMGSPEQVQKIAPWLRRKQTYGLKVVGYIYGDTVHDKPDAGDTPFLGTVCDLECIFKTQRIEQLILLEIPPTEEALYLSMLCDQLGIRLLMINNIAEKLQKPLAFMEDDGLQVIAFRQEPLECPFNQLLKRALDIAISLPVVLCILPLTNMIVYLMQCWQAPGPLFFYQRRTGLHHEEFFICKYRTMRVENPQESLQATADDPRVFPAGRWLRKHSIDELPQFLNVLKGEMSIVGPRPHLPEHTDSFNQAAQGFRIRSFIKPGITGLAQVEGFRGEIKELKNLTDRIRSDLYYLENWSFALECKIIIKTTRQVILPPKSAY